MGSVQHLHRITMRCIVLLFVCLLFHILLTDCGPVRKKRSRSKNASAEIIQGMKTPKLNRSSKVFASVGADLRQVIEMNRDVVQFDQVNFAGKRVAADHGNEVGNEDVAGSSPLPGVSAPWQSAAGGERVGQLPPVIAIPGSSQVNTSSEDQKVNLVKNGEVEHPREEQGVAVGVGGMNRELSTTQAQKVYHKGPDSSLDIGAADRGGSLESRQKAQSQNEPADNNPPSDTGRSRESDGLSVNPALQQPPPQVREPPVDQFRDQQIQLGPVKPDREAPVPVPIGQHPAPLGRDEVHLIGTRESNAAAEANNEAQPKEHPLKFDQQKKDVANENQLVKLDEVNPPDHMEGVRMEQDGHLNRDYKKEIFLGHHEEFEWSDEEKVSGRLKVIFRRVDTNRDNYMDANEIQVWIMKNVKVHLDDAIKDNAKVFRHLDADKDGYVSWLEFFSHFLVAKGYVHSAKDVPQNESAVTLETDDKERILRYKYRWTDADDEPKDEKLDINEMMNFRHPEQSKLMIERLIKELIDNVDKDGDGIITEAEFVALPHDLDGQNLLPMEEEWQEERKKEFQDVIDLNKDGKADDKELKIYFDPHNVNHAKLEADNLIRMADSDNDGRLSVEEVLDNTELFVGSKMVDARRKLHDEF